MKTIKIISTALVVAFSLSAIANEKKSNRKMKNAKKSGMVISAPAMEFGNPADVNNPSIERLKTSPYLLFDAPEMSWGSTEELDLKAIEKLKNAPIIPAPPMVWGDPNEVQFFEITEK